ELEILGAAPDDGGALAIEDARREKLADEPDARLAAPATLLRPVRADQRRRERDPLRREQRAKVRVRTLEVRTPEALAAEPRLVRHDDDLVAGVLEPHERRNHARHQQHLLGRIDPAVRRLL